MLLYIFLFHFILEKIILLHYFTKFIKQYIEKCREINSNCSLFSEFLPVFIFMRIFRMPTLLACNSHMKKCIAFHFEKRLLKPTCQCAACIFAIVKSARALNSTGIAESMRRRDELSYIRYRFTSRKQLRIAVLFIFVVKSSCS